MSQHIPIAFTVPLSSAIRATQASSSRGASAVNAAEQAERDWFFDQLITKCRAGYVSPTETAWLLSESGRTQEDLDRELDRVFAADHNANASQSVASSKPVSEEKENPMASSFTEIKAQWEAKLAEKKQQLPHLSKQQVVSMVGKEHPELRERLIAAANAPPTIPATSAKAESYRRVKSEWDAALATKRQSNPRLSWDQVVAAVCKENRALRERLVEAANAS